MKKISFYEYDPEIVELPYGWTHPPGVPKDDTELFDTHKDFILRILKRHNKVDRNLEDLYQGVCLRLVEAQVLKKFLRGAARRLPPEMEATEVCAFLGITPQAWVSFLKNHRHARTLGPLKGSRFGLRSVWETATICEFDYEETVKGKYNRVRPRMTSRGWKTYLQRSIHNAFANLCRTKDRRHKEHVLTPNTVLSPLGDGSYKQSTGSEDFSAWEVNLAAAMTADEADLIDLRDFLRKIDLDLDSQQGVEVLDFLIQQGRASNDGPRRNMEVLSLLGEGYTLAEAARKVQHRARMRAKAAG